VAVLVTSSGETNVATEEAAADVDKTETAEAVAEAVVAAFEACAHAGDGIPTPPLSRITHCKCRACKWSSEDRHTHTHALKSTHTHTDTHTFTHIRVLLRTDAGGK